jgi:plasmid stabilization system protein ParE
MIYEFHPEAEQEFVEAAVYYERNVTGLGERFGSEVHHAIERLLEYPELGSPIDADVRRLMLTRFPYFLIYSFTTDLLRVIAVAHTRRRPGYWRYRVNR